MMSFIKRLVYPFIARLINSVKYYEHSREIDRIRSNYQVGDNFSLGYRSRIISPKYISFGYNCSIGRGCRIEAVPVYNDMSYSPDLRIGNDVTMEDYCHIGCVEKVEIGDGTMIASRVFITDHFHGDISKDDLAVRPALRKLSTKPVSIGKNVWIGEGVSIMPGVVLGDNVIVGANAVVTHSFGSNAVIAGCPAKVLRYLDEE